MSDEKVWSEVRHGTLELNPSCECLDVTVNIGAKHVVTIDKMYGPLSVFPIRARIDYEAYVWVVERNHGDGQSWIEVARIPCWPTGEVPGDDDDA